LPTWPKTDEWKPENWGWTDMIIHALGFYDGTAPIAVLLRALESSRASEARGWKAKVRSTLRQDSGNFLEVAPRVWSIRWPPLDDCEGDIMRMMRVLRARRRYQQRRKVRH
jgi:hypothetical protein